MSVTHQVIKYHCGTGSFLLCQPPPPQQRQTHVLDLSSHSSREVESLKEKANHRLGGRRSQESERDTGCPLPLLTAPPHLLNQRRAAFLALHIYWLRYMNSTLDMSVCDTPRCGTVARFPFLCFLSFTKGRSGAMTKEGLIPSQVLEERIQCVVWSPETFRVQRERDTKESKGIEKPTKS